MGKKRAKKTDEVEETGVKIDLQKPETDQESIEPAKESKDATTNLMVNNGDLTNQIRKMIDEAIIKHLAEFKHNPKKTLTDECNSMAKKCRKCGESIVPTIINVNGTGDMATFSYQCKCGNAFKSQGKVP